MRAAIASGGPPSGTMPLRAIISRSSGVASASFTPPFSATRIGAGVPAGAAMPIQDIRLRSGKPASATVGTLGNNGVRESPLVISGTARPAATCCATFGTASNIRSTWPASRSFIAGAPPR